MSFRLLCAVIALGFLAGARTSADDAPLGSHYLLLVNGTWARAVSDAQLKLLDASPYDGLAVRFIGQYDATPPPSVDEMTTKIRGWRQITKKDFWPWVSLNRMMGRAPGSTSQYGNDPYFAQIHGADLEDANGAQSDFLQIWKNSLRAAKTSGLPGIIVDPELYMNYAAYEPAVLAKQYGKSTQQTIDLLHQLGAKLADIAGAEYPGAVLWFFFTDLGQFGWKPVDGVSYYPVPAYIVLGMLDRINEKNYSLKIISGGEVGLEYCSFSVEHLKTKIKTRARDFAPSLQKYGKTLELAGTMILWPDRSNKSEFMTEGPCGKSDAATVEDQQPYLEVLFSSYRYNWIYGTHNSGYDPFDATRAPRFHSVLSKARERARSHTSQ